MSAFKIPEKAQADLVEYPKGSGVIAAYAPEEREFLRRLARTSPEEAALVHALKAEFSGTLVDE